MPCAESTGAQCPANHPEYVVAQREGSVGGKGGEKVGDKIVLDQADRSEKAEIIGKVFPGSLLGNLTKSQLLSLWHSVGPCFFDDLQHLAMLSAEGHTKDDGCEWRLSNAGLMVTNGIDAGDMTALGGGGMNSTLISIGKMLLKYLRVEAGESCRNAFLTI